MAPTPDGFSDVARAIQLALAPVFLLTGIVGMLNVMAGRLSRIIDRGRALTEGQSGRLSSGHESWNLELNQLERRRHFASVGITSCTIAALLVCIVIAALFLEVMLDVQLKWLIGALFTVAMLVLVVGLHFSLTLTGIDPPLLTKTDPTICCARGIDPIDREAVMGFDWSR